VSMLPDLQHWRINNWLNMQLIEVNLSIWTEEHRNKTDNQTVLYQDDEQHNTALRRRHHNTRKKKETKNTISICENHLFKLKKNNKKIYRWVIYNHPLTRDGRRNSRRRKSELGPASINMLDGHKSNMQPITFTNLSTRA
jgi:hypothetical protein